MKDVARACGVSVVTVSRALRGDRNHSPETRRRICDMAAAMGYRSNPLVSALMSERGRHKPRKATVNLGLINLGANWKTHLFYRGVVHQAESLGYRIELFSLAAGKPAAQRLRRILQHRGVRGLIVLPAPQADWKMDFDFEGFAAATIGSSIISPPLPRVTTDTYNRLLQALQEMDRRGYRRLGLLGSRDLDHRFHYQITAAVQVYRQVGKPRAKIFSLDAENKADSVDPRTLVNWIRRHRIDGVISQLGNQYDALIKAGVLIPEMLGYLHLHRHENSAVTQMDQMQEGIGRKAADVVIGMINRNEFRLPAHPQTVMIPSVWREGETCPPRTRRPTD